jgi:hypothetical protein
MDTGIKWGVIFGIIGFVVAGIFTVAGFGCCNFVTALLIGGFCGAVAAGALEKTFSPVPRNIMKEGTKSAALASLIMVVGHFFGQLTASVLWKKVSMELTEKWLDQLNLGQLAQEASEGGYWFGAVVGSLCCSIVFLLVGTASGALGVWIYQKIWK